MKAYPVNMNVVCQAMFEHEQTHNKRCDVLLSRTRCLFNSYEAHSTNMKYVLPTTDEYEKRSNIKHEGKHVAILIGCSSCG